MKSNKKGHKIGIMTVLIGIILIGTGAFLFLNDTNNKNNDKNEKTKNKIVEVTIDEKIREVYSKFHSSTNPVQLSGSYIESQIYNTEKYNATDISKSFPIDYGNKILETVKNKLNELGTVNTDEFDNLLQRELEVEFSNFFGKNISYNKNIFACFEISQTDGKVNYVNNCGDSSLVNARFELIKAEKDNNNLYLYEKVKIKDTSSNEVSYYTYKWVYSKQNDGNYYFLRAERISKEDTVIDDDIIDLDKINNEIITSINNKETNVYVASCEDKLSVENIGVEFSYKKLDKDVVGIIINKLKSANKVEQDITFSYLGCPAKKINVIVADKDTAENVRFGLEYADSENILLLGYNGVGYAFHYNDSKEVVGFIESLK